jgi:hypothetical protein
MSNPATPGAVEVILFKSRPAITDDQIFDAADAFERDLVSYSGYLGRRLFKGEDRQWFEIIEWTSLGEIEAAQTIIEKPGARAFLELIDMNEVQILHVTPARVFGATSR